MQASIVCTNCGKAYPDRKLPNRCPKCGGLFDYSGIWTYDPADLDPSQPGIWRYRASFGLPEMVRPVSLGEGGTPLVWVSAFGRQIALKCEFLNPSGSFKDRGSTILASLLQARGVKEAVEDSSGNAGASMAAYAARAGVRLRVFVPAAASGPKRTQIVAYGAELVPVPGTRTAVSEAVQRAADSGAVYASHAFLPFNLPGYATAAYEIVAQLDGQVPGAVLVPAGQGGFLLGLARGFEAMRAAGAGPGLPKMIGVQARACAPLWALFSAGPEGLKFVAENPTLAEGVRTRFPVRGDAVLRAVGVCAGSIEAVDEAEILPARDRLARLGLYVEPTSAIVWAALERLVDRLPDPLVLVLTGSGLKYG